MNDPEPSHYWPLFVHMSKEHNLTLLDSEMDEIIRICCELEKKRRIQAIKEGWESV